MCLGSNYKHVWWRFPCNRTNTNVALWLRTSMDKPTIIIDSWNAGAWHSQFESPAKRPSFWGPEVTLDGQSCVVPAAWSPPLWFSGACWPATTLFFDYERPHWGYSKDLFWRFVFCKRRDSNRFIAHFSGKKNPKKMFGNEKNLLCHTLVWAIFLHLWVQLVTAQGFKSKKQSQHKETLEKKEKQPSKN